MWGHIFDWRDIGARILYVIILWFILNCRRSFYKCPARKWKYDFGIGFAKIFTDKHDTVQKNTEVNSRSILKVILCQLCWCTRCVAKSNNGQDGKVKSVNGMYLLVLILCCKTYFGLTYYLWILSMQLQASDWSLKARNIANTNPKIPKSIKYTYTVKHFFRIKTTKFFNCTYKKMVFFRFYYRQQLTVKY